MAEPRTLARPYARAAFEYASKEEALDAWLSEHETQPDEAGHYVSVGIYYFDDTLEEEP